MPALEKDSVRLFIDAHRQTPRYIAHAFVLNEDIGNDFLGMPLGTRCWFHLPSPLQLRLLNSLASAECASSRTADRLTFFPPYVSSDLQNPSVPQPGLE